MLGVVVFVATGLAAAVAAVAVPPTSSPPLPPATNVAPSVDVTLPEPPSREADPVAAAVPGIVADGDVLDEQQRAERIADQLVALENQVASAAGVGTLCASVPVAAALDAGARWEHDGEVVREIAAGVRQPPGFGDCLVADADTSDRHGGLEPGTYQFVAIGRTGATSAAPTFVVGAEPLLVQLRNNGDEVICLVQMAPRRADRYEAFLPDAPLQPGELLDLTIAAVEQEVRVFDCPSSGDLADADVERSFRFVPAAGVVVDLADDRPAATTPSTPASSPQGEAPTSTSTSTTVA